MAKQCFVIGPFGEEGSKIRQWSNSLMDDVIQPLANEFGYDARRSIDFAKPRDITSDMVARLLQADLVVADLTAANANVYYELAIRHAIERPFIHIIQNGQLPPFDIKNLDVLSIPTRKKFGGIALPDRQPSLTRLKPYFAAVADGSASYASILSGQQVGKALHGALAEIETQRAAAQRESQLLQSRLPDHIQRAIFKHANGSPMYYSRFDYIVELTHVGSNTEYVMTVDFELVNVSDHSHTVVSQYPIPTKDFEVRAAAIAGRDIDLDDPNNYSGGSLNLRHSMAPGEACSFAVTMMKRFPEHDSDLFTAYRYPADRFSFKAINHSGSALQMWLEMLNAQGVQPRRVGDTLEWQAEDPILPHQGVRLFWRPKA